MLVTVDDLLSLGRQFRRPLAAARLLRRTDRAQHAWDFLEGTPTHWFDLPAVRERMETLPGSRERYVSYLARTYLKEGSHAVSLGCGGGHREMEWARSGRFAQLVGYDFAELPIREASRKATSENSRHVRFEQADVYMLEIRAASLDAVIFEDALHHFAPVSVLLDRVRRWLKPGGFVFVREFVGPRRFQFPRRQIDCANALLTLLPEELRRKYRSGRVKRRIENTGSLRMRLRDPSEAVESDLIVPSLHERFNVLEHRQLGGTLVNLVLGDIVHNFTGAEAELYLSMLFAIEDTLIESGHLRSDHALLVCQVP